MIPDEKEPVTFGLHGAVEHYGVAPDAFEPHASAVDSIVVATAG